MDSDTMRERGEELYGAMQHRPWNLAFHFPAFELGFNGEI